MCVVCKTASPWVTGTQAVWGNAWETEPLGSLYLRIPRVVYLKECSSGHLKQALIKKFRFLDHLPYTSQIRISEIGHLEYICFDRLFLGWVSKLKTCIWNQMDLIVESGPLVLIAWIQLSHFCSAEPQVLGGLSFTILACPVCHW